MSASILNTRNANVTPQSVNSSVAQAKSALVLSKDSAAKAVAHAYIVWIDTQSPKARADVTNWFHEDVEARNKVIDAYNQELSTLKSRASKYNVGKLGQNDVINIAPKTDEDRQIIAAEIAKLDAVVGRDEKEWQALRKVRIESRNDASRFSLIVKWVFGFDRRADASITARYAKVMEWVDDNIGVVMINSADDVVELINAAGGFEDVLQAQRGCIEVNEEVLDDQKIINEALIAQAKDTVKQAPAKASFNMDVKHAPQGFVTLLARLVNGNVEVVGELPFDEAQLDKIVGEFNDEVLFPTNDRSEFVARVLALGELVGEGEKSSKKRDGLKAGEALKSERVLALLPDVKAGVQLLVSAVNADACVVVKATPNVAMVGLGAVNSPVVLAGDKYRELGKIIRNRANRRLVDIVHHVEAGNITWVAGNSALIAKNRENGRRSFNFDDVSVLQDKPLDVEMFKAQFAVKVTSSDFCKLYAERLKEWSEKTNGDKAKKLMSLTFNDGSMAYKVAGQDEHVTTVAGACPGRVSLSFRPRDLHDLVKVLAAANADAFDVLGDEGGLFRVKWSDSHGAYEVNIPTATTDGRLESRRLVKVRVQADLVMAA